MSIPSTGKTIESATGGWRSTGTIALLMAFASISTDLYLPAMPAMAQDLRASEGQMAFTITGFLIGFSLGQLVWGPLSDRVGRRAPLLIGITLFLAGTAGCALAADSFGIIACRLIQAIGASAGVVLSRAMVRDLYEGDSAARVFSSLMAVMAVAPLVGPLLGGQILVIAGWRAIFWTMIAVGLVAFIAVLRLPESLPSTRRSRTELMYAFSTYSIVLRRRSVLANAGTCGFFFFGTFAYIAASPMAYIIYHHVSTSWYGMLFSLGIVGIIVLNLLNARYVSRFGVVRMLLFGASMSAIAGIFVLLGAVLAPDRLAGLVTPMFVFVAVTGIVVANALSLALAGRAGEAGTISAVVGAVQYGSGVAGSAMVGLAANGTPVPMAASVALGGVGCLVCARWATRNVN